MIYRCVAVLLTLLLGVLNFRLYDPSAEEYTFEKVGDDVIPQLNFIETALRAGEGEQ